MHPILGRYGPYLLYSFTVVMGLGLGAAIGLTALLERRSGRLVPGWIDGLLVILIAALIGGRIPYVWANWAYFQEHPGKIALVWQGGLSYHGALLAALLALWIWATWRRRSFNDYAGLLAAGFVLGSVFGWLACWLEGCAFGRETTIGPLAADLPDNFGVYGLRYQTQLMGLVLTMVVLPFVLLLRERVRPGVLIWITLLLLSAGRLIVTLFRGDEMPLIGQFRMDTLADAALALICLLMLGIILARKSGQRDRI